MTLGRMTYKQQNSCEVYVRVQSAQLSRVNNTGCWLLLVSTFVSIKIFLIVIHSHRMMMNKQFFMNLFIELITTVS